MALLSANIQLRGAISHKLINDIVSRDFYVYYPLLFHQIFTKVPARCYEELTVAATLKYVGLVLLDRVADSQNVNPANMVSGLYLKTLASEKMRNLVNGSGKYASYELQYEKDFVLAMIVEQGLGRRNAAKLSRSRYFELAKAKTSPSKTVTTALCIMDNKTDLIDILDQSQDLFHCGYQLIDDLRDWPDDWKKRQFGNFILQELKEVFPELDNSCYYMTGAGQRELNHFIYSQGLAKSATELAEAHFVNSLEHLAGLPHSNWHKKIAAELSMVRQLQERLPRMEQKCTRPEVITNVYHIYRDLFGVNQQDQSCALEQLIFDRVVEPNKKLWDNYANFMKIRTNDIVSNLCEMFQNGQLELLKSRLKNIDLDLLTAKIVEICTKATGNVVSTSIFFIVGAHRTTGFWTVNPDREYSIVICLEMLPEQSEDKTIKELSRILIHEYSHCLRYELYSTPTDVLEIMVSEGISLYFEKLIAPDIADHELLFIDMPGLQWMEENEDLAWNLLLSAETLKDPKEAVRLFFSGKGWFQNGIPKRIGYFLGNRLLSRATQNKSIAQVLLQPASQFIKEYRRNRCSRLKIQQVTTEQISNAIIQGLEYLRSQTDAEFTWSDFHLATGASDEWVTSLCGLNIVGAVDQMRDKRLNHSWQPALAKAVHWILARSHSNPTGWGFNSSSGVDSDSTACALLFLSSYECFSKEYLEPNQKRRLAHATLLEAQNKDGGFGTYSTNSIKAEFSRKNRFFPIQDLAYYQGWLSSDPYITAICLLALDNSLLTSNVRQTAIRYLEEMQLSSGLWPAYWSISNLLATYYCTKLLGKYSDHGTAFRCVDSLLETQQAASGWDHCNDNLERKESNPYDSALGMGILLNYDEMDDSRSKLKSKNTWNSMTTCVNYLLACQETTGAWKESYSMRVPFSWDTAQLSIQNESCVSKDVQRTLTTSLVIFQLSRYINRVEKT